MASVSLFYVSKNFFGKEFTLSFVSTRDPSLRTWQGGEEVWEEQKALGHIVNMPVIWIELISDLWNGVVLLIPHFGSFIDSLAVWYGLFGGGFQYLLQFGWIYIFFAANILF